MDLADISVPVLIHTSSFEAIVCFVYPGSVAISCHELRPVASLGFHRLLLTAAEVSAQIHVLLKYMCSPVDYIKYIHKYSIFRL